MTDERHRPRRHDLSDQPTEQLDLERLRYFTQPADGKPTTRHRRRREASTDPTITGPQPRVEARPPGTDTWGAPTPPPPRRRPPERVMPAYVPPPAEQFHDRDRPGPRAGDYDDPRRRAVPHRVRPGAEAAATDVIEDERTAAGYDTDDDAEGYLALEDTPTDSRPPRDRRNRRRGGGGRRPRPTGRKIMRRRIVLGVALACMLVLVVGVAVVGLRAVGVFGPSVDTTDYTNAAGTADVVVDIPQDSTLMDFGVILESNDVVGSVQAFVDAADGQPISGGFYKLRTQIPAATAVEMMTDGNANRVGRMVVPEGLQLDNKEGVDGKITPGIFQMIENATSVTVNGQQIGTDVAELEAAAADSTPEQLGVPEWARSAVENLDGDHRRIEGLIAPGTWESIDPDHSPTQILHDLIVASAARFEEWGLLAENESGLTPYETLVTASVVEREVANPGDYAKVARVILNRLDEGQRLEMDSTTNYTADVTNIDVYGEAYRADNEWNTYRIEGLPATPIGAVGERALTAVENPTPGDWLYFVTIDRDGTTLFAETFEEHTRNRERACENELLSTGCS
ncbi:endolytic transglycosylase MltG [Gordonia sp. LSe1-13]|uniref:Endolytic murein transglycosylase n=1 Tax=Gordonia sesuvii TaxID=3116777 RepID=A0ABU7MBR3_9ACTN|nr:endolytic transglycosylase MltG [Gordonia sp. LSe1-13]